MYTNTWPKVADGITVPSNPDEPCHEKTCHWRYARKYDSNKSAQL